MEVYGSNMIEKETTSALAISQKYGNTLNTSTACNPLIKQKTTSISGHDLRL